MRARRYFGTDGIRGPAGGPVVNADFFARLGQAAGLWLAAQGAAGGSVLVGRDPRASGAALATALERGLLAAGCRPADLGVVPTPAVSRAVRSTGAALGAVVTASHNPAGDNGVKFFGPGGGKLSDAEEAAIESFLPPLAPAPKAAAASLRAEDLSAQVLADYMDAAGRILPAFALQDRLIALDTANGATAVTSPGVLRRLGATLVALGDQPDGANINAGVGSEHPAAVAALVRSSGAWLGLAHDGDGDRCVLCDEQGAVLDGDELLTILALDALARGALAAGTLVVTVQSNLGVDAAVAAAGGRVVRTPVGDRYVAERMRAEGAVLGGESSGHIVCFAVGPTGDGLAAALLVAGVMARTGRPLSELRRSLRRFPQATAALVVPEKRPLAGLSALPPAIAALEQALGAQGRVLVRYSGTEPKLRLLVEGPDATAVERGLATLVAAARSDLL